MPASSETRSPISSATTLAVAACAAASNAPAKPTSSSLASSVRDDAGGGGGGLGGEGGGGGDGSGGLGGDASGGDGGDGGGGEHAVVHDSVSVSAGHASPCSACAVVMDRDRVRRPPSPHGPQVPQSPHAETTQSTSAYSECDTRRRRRGSDEEDRVSPRFSSSSRKGTSAPPSRSASRANAASPSSISSFKKSRGDLFCAILSTSLAQSRESTSACGALAGFMLGDAFTSTSQGVGTSGTPSFPSSSTDEKSDPSSSTKSNRNVSKKCAARSGNDGSFFFPSFARAMAEATNGAAASIAATMVSVARVRTASAAPAPYRASRNAESARHAVGASSGEREPAPSRASEGTSHAAGYSRLITSSARRSSDAKRSRVSSNSNASQ